MATDTHSDCITLTELDPETRELLELVQANTEDLRELLLLVLAVRSHGETLTETTEDETVSDSVELTDALADDDLAVLAEAVREHSTAVTELVELTPAIVEIAAELTAPDTDQASTQHPLRALRETVEREETTVLIRHLGENAESLVELLELLETAHRLFGDLVPELRDATTELRGPIAELRLVTAGIIDVQQDNERDSYELGRRLGRALELGASVGDEDVAGTLDAGLEAFRTDEPPSRPGPIGVLLALRDTDVRAGLGRVIDMLRRMGAYHRD